MGAGVSSDAAGYVTEKDALDSGYTPEQIRDYLHGTGKESPVTTNEVAPLRDKIKLAQNQVRDLMEKKERLKKDKRQLAETVKQRQEESKSLMQVVVGLKDRRRATEEKISVLRRARQRETSLLQLQNLHCFLSRADAAAQAPGEDDSEDLNNQKETLVGRLVELAEQYEAKLLPRRLAWAENSELSGKIKEQSRSQRSLQQRRASLLKSRREERELYSPPTLVVGEGANSVGEEYLSPSKAKEWFRVQEIPATPHHRSFLTDQIVSPLEQSPKNEVVKPSTPTKQTSAQNGKKLDISVGDDGRDAFHAAYHGGLIFKRDKFLGAGAFGRVFLVFTEDGLPLAMKQIRLPLASDGYDPDDVLRECNILKGLSHRNIVSAHHVDVDSESVKLFMEYLPLGSVKQLISQQGPLKELACRNYIRQALRGWNISTTILLSTVTSKQQICSCPQTASLNSLILDAASASRACHCMMEQARLDHLWDLCHGWLQSSSLDRSQGVQGPIFGPWG
jgi:hypothetical protein